MKSVFNEEMYSSEKEQHLRMMHPEVREVVEKILPLLQGVNVEVVDGVISEMACLVRLYRASFVTTFDEPK